MLLNKNFADQIKINQEKATFYLISPLICIAICTQEKHPHIYKKKIIKIDTNHLNHSIQRHNKYSAIKSKK